MIFVPRFLVFGIIKKIVGGTFKVIYSILEFLHLQLTLLCVTLGVLLEIAFGIVLKNDFTLKVFHIIIAVTLVYAVIRTVAKLLGLDKKKKKASTAEIVEVKQEEPALLPSEEEKPVYYRVKQNPQYVMAEFSDRYELFLDTKDSLKYIRTDYKDR